MVVDDVLAQMVRTGNWTLDQRYNFSFVARPSPLVKALIDRLQRRLLSLAGADGLWCPSPSALHCTIYEVTHSRTAEQLEAVLERVRVRQAGLFDLPLSSVTLDPPLVNFDTAAVALTFLPCDDTYTFHHLRRDVYARVADIGLAWTGRYIAPTAHITIARFIDGGFPSRPGLSMPQWVDGLEQLRAECRHWDGRWVLSEGFAEVSTGRSWYGSGYSV